MIIWKLRQLMEEKRITGKELAERVGKHYNTIYRFRESNEMPSIDGNLLNKLCNALDCSLNDLVEFIPDVRPTKTGKTVASPHTSNTTAVVTAATVAAIQAARAIGSTDSDLVSQIAASVAQIVLNLETEKSGSAEVDNKEG